MLYRVRVRGIYATALAVLLSRRGFILSDVSDVLKARLKGPVSTAPPHVTVKSSDDRPEDLLVIGYPWEAGEEVESSIVETVEYAVVRRSKMGLYSVVDGVSLGDCKAMLPNGVEAKIQSSSCPGKGELVRLSVVREALDPGADVIARPEVRVIGEYVMVIHPGEGVSYSEHIRDMELRSNLMAGVSSRVDLSRFHVRFRSNSKLATLQAVVNEAEKLARRAETLYREEPGREPRIVSRGEYLSIVTLPGPAKRVMDDLRSTVYPTIDMHHSLKGSGSLESMLVDYAEEALSKGSCDKRAGFSAVSFIASRLVGKRVTIDHRTPDGRVHRLGPYTVESYSSDEGSVSLVLRRVFRKPGVLDGINVAKEPGDIAVTRVSTDSWVTIHEYLTKDGRPLGYYANINTPPEIGFEKVRYIDLYIDVVKRPGEEPLVIDREELDEAYKRGYVTRALYDKALKEAEKAVKRLASLS